MGCSEILFTALIRGKLGETSQGPKTRDEFTMTVLDFLVYFVCRPVFFPKLCGSN